VRACRRYGHDYAARAEAGLGAVALVPIDAAVLDTAATLDPPGLRSLDALHLATALSLGESLGVFIAYDSQLLDAALTRGIPTAAPA
jgi:uncharacterized protein